MTTGCWGDQFDDDDGAGRHHKNRGDYMTDHIARILAGMNENELRELLGAVDAERNQHTPTLADGAELYRREQQGGMRIPSGVSPERLAELLRQASPGDTFRIDGDQSSHVNVSRNG